MNTGFLEKLLVIQLDNNISTVATFAIFTLKDEGGKV
jgi:hypothetical protein